MKPDTTFAEAFPILAGLESVPLSICQVAWERVTANTKAKGVPLPLLIDSAGGFTTTMEFLIQFWSGIKPEDYTAEQFHALALAHEYVLRMAKLNQPLSERHSQ